MRMLNLLFATGVLVAAVPMAASATVYSLNQGLCTGGCGTSPFGTVTVQSAGMDTISIDVTLLNGNKFVNTGAGTALLFDLIGNPTITISSLTSGFSAGQTAHGAALIHADGSGHWEYSIDCSLCGSGGSGPQPGPLDFDVTAPGLTPSSFVANDNGFFFASDIIGTNGNTGDVVSSGVCTLNCGTDTVPEPGSLMMLGLAALGLALIHRRRAISTPRL